ncbi:Os12g0637300 [Oryza sativa Japonica Group]|uniref:Os12g0637300 protein n=1 Tax=Oryza sativa subsp. japonica TaxID=39947 RepID=A0A0P0YCM6_ORYSJ|nr:Os12g0637300 [Oryza sativa Japonica Group]
MPEMCAGGIQARCLARGATSAGEDEGSLGKTRVQSTHERATTMEGCEGTQGRLRPRRRRGSGAGGCRLLQMGGSAAAPSMEVERSAAAVDGSRAQRCR